MATIMPPTQGVPTNRPCSVPGCNSEIHCKGLCNSHYRRMLRNGSPIARREMGRPRGQDATYNAVHLRLLYDRGPARAQSCIGCGQRAQSWSYDHRDPNEMIDGRGRPYSLKQEHYQPRCWPCHNPIDRAAKRERASAA